MDTARQGPVTRWTPAPAHGHSHGTGGVGHGGKQRGGCWLQPRRCHLVLTAQPTRPEQALGRGDRSEEDRESLRLRYSWDRYPSPNKNRNNPRQVFKNTQASAFPYSSNLHVSHQAMYKVTESSLMGRRCPFILNSPKTPAAGHLLTNLSSQGTQRR